MGAIAVAGLALATASLAQAVSVQSEGVRIAVFAQIKPHKLPRTETAPIAVSVAGHLEATDGTIPPQLREMTVEVNRHGVLQRKGLPSCPPQKLRAASSEKALELCGGALIGSGRFWAHIVLPEQGSYPTRGELLIFNSKKADRLGPHLHL